MPWTNGPLVLYHGTDEQSANSIMSTGVNVSFGKALTDFGLGFYTTTNLVQAKSWANVRCKLLRIRTSSPVKAVVVELRVDRDELAKRQCLAFVTENSNTDFWDLIRACRTTRPPTQAHRVPVPPGVSYYDVVYGPVSLWPQPLVVKDCDQISFHTPAAQTMLRTVVPTIRDRGTPLFP